ncbi:MAG: creatininase family protein, partial [Nocardioides sp.]
MGGSPVLRVLAAAIVLAAAPACNDESTATDNPSTSAESSPTAGGDPKAESTAGTDAPEETATVDTDLAVDEAFAQRLDAELGDDALLCPSLPYGLSEHHLAFPGTITLRPDTFIGVLLDLVESLAHWDLRRVLVVNGHGGNIDALRLVSG